ncbi:hypothetical protein [Pseudonocardia sp. ICBG1293]|uniref:hypothetical protein n=1 Tax=Pseudonocardia sp. ICBG1293 TaxID=2844382 RepID=UPI001CCEC11A|nr:hypothetical protein [Pseudonocardia sp. ICBG1293]
MELLDLVLADDGPPLTVLTGHVGTGRTTVLRDAADALRSRGRTVVEVRVAPDGVFVGETDNDPMWTEHAGYPFAHLQDAATDREVASRIASTIAAPLVARDTVVLIDDGQWMAPDGVAALTALAFQLAGTAVRCVCSIALPYGGTGAASGVAGLRRLRAACLAATVRVPPLDRESTARAVAELLHAEPAPELVSHVRARSRGIAAVVTDVVSTLRSTDGVRVMAGYAHLSPAAAHGRVVLSTASPAVHLRRLDDRTRQTAAATAALEPAGSALPVLLARALQRPQHELRAELDELEAAGFLRRTRAGGWRFLLPALRDHLSLAHGPWLRRSLAAVLVRASWDGTVGLDRSELADLTVVAGRLVPTERARGELLAAAQDAAQGPAELRHAQWWQAVAELTTDHRERLRMRLEHARACERAGEAAATVAAARELLHEGDALDADARDELALLLTVGLIRTSETDELDLVLDGSADWMDDETIAVACRALALGIIGRWSAAATVLAGSRTSWTARRLPRDAGTAVQWVGDVYAGRLRPADLLVTEGPPTSIGPDHRDHPLWAIGCLITLGDSRGARSHAERAGLADADLPPSHRGALALLECRPESPALAWSALTEPDDTAAGLTRATFHYLLIGLTMASGQIGVARQLVETARKEVLLGDHVVDFADVSVDLALGEAGTAQARLVAALERARSDDLLVGTDLILSVLVSLAQLRGDEAGARLRMQELDEVARALQSPRASMHAAFARATAHRDTTAVEEFLRLAEETGPEYESTHLTLRLVGTGLADPALLHDVYAVYGRLDAPLYRAWTRAAMEAHGVPVPGRAQTKAENERLLGRLLIEGLSNRQIATLLGSSAKSVEGRLGRLFARTGYRSRIELASALLEHGSLVAPPDR